VGLSGVEVQAPGANQKQAIVDNVNASIANSADYGPQLLFNGVILAFSPLFVTPTPTAMDSMPLIYAKVRGFLVPISVFRATTQ